MDLESAKKDAVVQYWRSVKLALSIIIIRSKPEHLSAQEYAGVLIERNIQRNLQTSTLKENKKQLKEISTTFLLEKNQISDFNNKEIFALIVKLKSLLDYVEDKLTNLDKNENKIKWEENVLEEIKNSIFSTLEIIQTNIQNKTIQFISPNIVKTSVDLISKIFSSTQNFCAQHKSLNVQTKMEKSTKDCEVFIYFLIDLIMDSNSNNSMQPFYSDILFHLSQKSLLIFITTHQIVEEILKLSDHLSLIQEGDQVNFNLFLNSGFLFRTLERLLLDFKENKKEELKIPPTNNIQDIEIFQVTQTQLNSTQNELSQDFIETKLPEFEFVKEKLENCVLETSDKFPLFASYIWRINYIINCPLKNTEIN